MDIENYKGEITKEVGYLEGVNYTPRSGMGIQQRTNYNSKFIFATQRQPNGILALISISKGRMSP